jgi:hypothetical protein
VFNKECGWKCGCKVVKVNLGAKIRCLPHSLDFFKLVFYKSKLLDNNFFWIPSYLSFC